MIKLPTLLSILAIGLSSLAYSQDSMLDLLGDDEPTQDFATAGFKTTRIINGHSFELNSQGVLDFKISHRFGRINGGPYEFFGLDAASMRIGLDYGVTEWLNVGIGRSNVGKMFDGFAKVRILRQQTGKKNIPVHLLFVSDVSLTTLRNTNPDIEPYLFSNRLNYTHQLILGRKFSKAISLQLMPTMVHRNFVMTKQEANDVFVIGAGGRVKLTNRIAVNAEYYYALPNQLDPLYTNSFSIGFDIETGGHVFQLHFTNSSAMVESAFLTQTDGKWSAGDIQFGFNVSRVFTVYRPKKK